MKIFPIGCHISLFTQSNVYFIDLGQMVYSTVRIKNFGTHESAFQDSWLKFKMQNSILGIPLNVLKACFSGRSTDFRIYQQGI